LEGPPRDAALNELLDDRPAASSCPWRLRGAEQMSSGCLPLRVGDLFADQEVLNVHIHPHRNAPH